MEALIAVRSYAIRAHCKPKYDALTHRIGGLVVGRLGHRIDEDAWERLRVEFTIPLGQKGGARKLA